MTRLQRMPCLAVVMVASCGSSAANGTTYDDDGSCQALGCLTPNGDSGLLDDAAVRDDPPAKGDVPLSNDAPSTNDGGIARCPSTPPLPNATDCAGWIAGTRCRFPLGDIVAVEGECTCAAENGTKLWSCSSPPPCAAGNCSTGQVCVTRGGGPRVSDDAAPDTAIGECKDRPASCIGRRDCSCQDLCGSQPGTGIMCIENTASSFACEFP